MIAFIVVLGVIIFLLLRALVSPRRPSRSGLQAHGIVLSASRFAGSKSTVNGMRYETRDIRLDVEIPGRDPYEVSVSPLIPRICEVYPGTRLDLRVDPRNPNGITVIGPAGSAGWIDEMPTIFPGGLGPLAMGMPGLGGKSGNNTAAIVIALIVVSSFEFCAVGAQVSDCSPHKARLAESTEPSEPAAAKHKPAGATTTSAPDESPSPSEPLAPFDMAAAKARLSAVAPNIQSCKMGQTGSGRVVVTFAPSGLAQSAVVKGAPFEGTDTGRCISSVFRLAHVSPFAGSPVSVTKTFTLN
jgi:hypothetical protein